MYLCYLEEVGSVFAPNEQTNERANEKKKRNKNKTKTGRQEKFHMSCIAYLSHIVAYVVKLKRKHTLWKKAAKKRHVEYFSVTRYLFSCLWHWQRRPFRSLHVRAIHNQTHTPRIQSIRAAQQTCMQNKSISKCYLHAALFLIIFSNFFQRKKK